MKILMVCLGNICRSPVAEGILRSKIEASSIDSNIIVDSCGTSDLHEGQSPDERSSANALENGLDISTLRSRPLTRQDFEDFDLIYCMDQSNYQNAKVVCPSEQLFEKVDLLLNLSHPGQNKAVPDPYFGGSSGFQNVFDLIDEACEILLNKIEQ